MVHIETFERTENGQITVMVGKKPILEKITYISSRYQSIGIYENDPPIPSMVANGKPVTADKMYLFEIIAIENGRYMRLLKVDCDNLRYSDSEALKDFTKDKYNLTCAALEETRVQFRSKLYVKEKEHANADVHNQGADRLRYDVSCFVKEILLNTLYILGDVVDRYPDGIAILQRIMKMPIVKMLLGNHE